MPPRIALQLRCSRNSTNIRIPLIYFVNRFFLMFGRVGNIKAFSCMHDPPCSPLPMMPRELLRSFAAPRNSANIRIPLIYFVNRFFLMFGRVGNIKAFSCMHDLALLSSTYDAPRIAPQLCCSRNSTNIRIPLIYFVNRFFLMFGRVGNIKAFSCMHDLAFALLYL